MIAVVLVAGAFAGCGGQMRIDVVTDQTGLVDAVDQFQWRRSTPRDEFPAVADDTYPDVRIDRRSALRVDAGKSRYRLWLTHGERIGGGSWSDSFDPREVCLHLFDADLVLRGFQCTSVRDATVPGKLLMVLSGGAAGAPGLRPREVVIAGLAPDGADAVRAGAASKSEEVPLRERAFLVITRIDVDMVEFLRGDQVRTSVVVNACQRC